MLEVDSGWLSSGIQYSTQLYKIDHKRPRVSIRHRLAYNDAGAVRLSASRSQVGFVQDTTSVRQGMKV